MTIDAHTPCPACPVQWRNVYACARALLLVRGADGDGLGPAEQARATEEITQALVQALQLVAPLVDAHLANQAHAHSHELVGARYPHILERGAL